MRKENSMSSCNVRFGQELDHATTDSGDLVDQELRATRVCMAILQPRKVVFYKSVAKQ